MARPLVAMGYIIQTLQHDYDDVNDVHQALHATIGALVGLSNPANIGELARKALVSPGSWSIDNGLQSSLTMISIFQTAALTIANTKLRSSSPLSITGYEDHVGDINFGDWLLAIQGGIRSAVPWQKLLVYAGLLLGSPESARTSPSDPASEVEREIGALANEILEAATKNKPCDCRATGSMVLALAIVFPRLSPLVRSSLNNDALALIAAKIMTSSLDGFENGCFVDGIIEESIVNESGQLSWAADTPSHVQIQAMRYRPLVVHSASISIIINHAIQSLINPMQALKVREQFFDLTQNVQKRWHFTKFAGVDPSEETERISPETLRLTLPPLRFILSKILAITTMVYKSVLIRTSVDASLSKKWYATATAAQNLESLRDLNFVAYHDRLHLSSSYRYVLTTSIDILARYESEAVQTLNHLLPHHPGRIPVRALDRSLDLFYLNVCEHFALKLSTNLLVKFIVRPVTPYLCPPDNLGNEYVEAAHSAYISMLASPNVGPLVDELFPAYIDILFKISPLRLSPDQFTVALRTLIQVTSPPSPIFYTHPDLHNSLLEVLNDHARHASGQILPGPPPTTTLTFPSQRSGPHSARFHYLLTMLACLEFLPIYEMPEWLDQAAELTSMVADHVMQRHIAERWVALLMGGMMDSNRAAVCHLWWCERSGPEGVHVLERAATSLGLGG